MQAIKVAVLSLAILAAAASGCTWKSVDHSMGRSADGLFDQSSTQVAAGVNPVVSVQRDFLESEKTKITIVLPAKKGTTKVFRGELGTYDQTTFDRGPGVNPVSREMLYVVSLDKDSGTLIAIHYLNGDKDSTGVAYVFHRKNPLSPYSFVWMAPGLTSKTATDVDTYLREHKATPAEAILATQVLRSGNKDAAAVAFK